MSQGKGTIYISSELCSKLATILLAAVPQQDEVYLRFEKSEKGSQLIASMRGEDTYLGTFSYSHPVSTKKSKLSIVPPPPPSVEFLHD